MIFCVNGNPISQKIFYEFSNALALENSPIKFYLTGSWAFGLNSPGISDLDIYTEYKTDTETFLIDEGYSLITSPMYGAAVYGDKLLKKLYGGFDIHIQLVDPIELKHKIQTLLESLPQDLQLWACGPYLLSKENKRYLWQLLGHIIHEPAKNASQQIVPPPVYDNPHICKACGSKGTDLLFTFFCSNPNCINYHP